MSSIHNILFGPEILASLGRGSVVDRVIGTGGSFPTFPCVVQYNGLILNNTAEFDYFHINSVDGIDDAEVRDNRAVRPNDDGEDAFATAYSGRSLVISGEIRAYHLWKTDDMKEALKRAFVRNSLSLPLRFALGDPEKDKIIFCKKVAKLEIPMAQPTMDMPWVNYMIPLRAEDPRILSFQPESVTHGPGEFAVVNDGNYFAQPTLRFYGPATTLTLAQTFEGSTFAAEVGPIASGHYLEVIGSKVKDDAGAHAYNKYSDDSDRIFLGPGPAENLFTLSGTGVGGGAQVTVQWRHSWI
jgi:hypothetical protein